MSKSLSALEYDWLKAQSGVTSKFLGDMWTEYYESLGIEEDDELGLLRYLINQAGGTPKNTKFTSDLWFQYFQQLGYGPTKSLNEGFAKFYAGESNPLVTNGGFETGTGSVNSTAWIGDEAYGWGAYKGGTFTFTASYDNTVAHSGSQSMKIVSTSSDSNDYCGVWTYPGGYT